MQMRKQVKKANRRARGVKPFINKQNYRDEWYRLLRDAADMYEERFGIKLR